MINALHSGPTWAWIIIAFIAGMAAPVILARILYAGSRAVAAIQYWGGRLVLIAIVIGGLYLGARAVA